MNHGKLSRGLRKALITAATVCFANSEVVIAVQAAERQAIPASELGIHDDTADVPGVKGDFCNSWVGYVGDHLIRVAAGFEFSNPLAGTLWITQGRKGPQWVFHTPTQTGPACIVAERNGILIVHSQSGQFVKEDRSLSSNADRDNFATAPGGQTYRFDLKTESFIK